MNAYGAGGDDHPSSSFFRVFPPGFKIPPNRGEEGNSQPSQGVGQRLPGSPLEISSPGISGESLFRDSVETGRGGARPSEAAPPANPGGSREAVPPANPAGSQEAGPSNQGPAPYPGDSCRGTRADLRGLRVRPLRAEDLFEVKAEILGEMSRLDPEGPWLERGARALDKPPGEESLERLFAILDALREGRTPVGGVR
ncbi:unnamed protein product [Prunus armeniaca]|uniref:DUF8018 domain-containing protein n=1 Tax=Prunus armeniaca TaxID=36596 RepID=A0A6J5V3P8_PRUAR|nr:unnamed protein product [Prunus armeniaca]